ncbi:MAG: ATP-binding protein, partial [Acidithiobacillus ferriphilus]
MTGAAKPVALRGQNSYSVILGVFHNAGYGSTVTLAQIFWMKDAQGQPARFFAMAESDLSITRDFSGFGTDIGQLRKRLRDGGIDIEDTFPKYSAWFRRRFGIENDQALELFHQTVSMKSVGNLTDFVRSHMLEPFDVAPRIGALITHFDDLSRAHAAVLKAKRQVQLLTPLVADCAQYRSLESAVDDLRQCREGLRAHFAGLKLALLDKRLTGINEDWTRLDAQVQRLDQRRSEQRMAVDAIRQAIAQNGGNRLEQLRMEIQRAGQERDRRRHKADRYAELVQKMAETPAAHATAFQEQHSQLGELSDRLREQATGLENQEREEDFAFRKGREEYETRSAEIASLKQRRSNINTSQIQIRSALCAALGVDEEEMPFTGELLQVRPEDSAWEGAAERLLHNFGLSLLVPDARYADVAAWVDSNQLRGRLVYFHVRPRKQGEMPELHPDSLLRKLSVKPDSQFYDWLQREMAHRFDVACCGTPEQFRRETRAITRAGQIKDPGGRHEKDDRHPIDDRSRYVLGWSNTAKIAALETTQRQFEIFLSEIGSRLGAIQSARKALEARLQTLARLEEFNDYEELDWAAIATEIARLEDERQALESASDILKSLNIQLQDASQSLSGTENQLEAAKDKRSKLEQRRSDTGKLQKETQKQLAGNTADPILSQKLEPLRREASGEHQLTVESCEGREQELRQWLQSKMDSENK